VELDALAVYAPDDHIQMIQDIADEFFDEEIHKSELEMRSSTEFKQEMRQLTVGSNGAIHVSWVDGTGRWNGPVPISQPNFATPGSPIAMA
jgi:hypothetical protein